MPEPHAVLIARSIALGLVAAVIVGLLVAGVCKLVDPGYDAGDPVLTTSLLVLLAVTATRVRRDDIRRTADPSRVQ